MDSELYNQLWKAKNLDGSLRVSKAPTATPQQVARELVEKHAGCKWAKGAMPALDDLVGRITSALEAREKSARESERRRIQDAVARVPTTYEVEGDDKERDIWLYQHDIMAAIAAEQK